MAQCSGERINRENKWQQSTVDIVRSVERGIQGENSVRGIFYGGAGLWYWGEYFVPRQQEYNPVDWEWEEELGQANLGYQHEKGSIIVKYCPTDEMLGDYMTKANQGKKFHQFWRAIMGMD